MIDRVSTVCLFVSDQERAKAFYTEILGFELRTDAPLYPGASARWIAVDARFSGPTWNSASVPTGDACAAIWTFPPEPRR